MVSKVRNIFYRALNLGIEEESDFDLYQKVRILNGLSMIAIVFLAFNSLWGNVLNNVFITVINFTTLVCMLLVLFLNSRHSYIFARALFFLSLAFHVGSIELIIDVGAHFYLFPLFIVAAFVIERKIYLYTYFSLILFLFVVSEEGLFPFFTIKPDPRIQQLITIIDGVVAFGLSIFSVSLFREQYAQNREVIIKQNQLLKKTAEISEEHAELASLLLSEMNHRVKNNLQVISSLLNIQANQLEDKAAKNAIHDSIQRISSIALIHRQLYQKNNMHSTKIDIAEYTNELIPFIKKFLTANENEITINVNVQKIILPVDEAVSVGLIINETITNSLKHGIKDQKNKTINLDIRRDGNEKIQIVVKDSGTGIQRMADENNAGFGYELIHTLVSNYRGNLIIDEVKNMITIELDYELDNTNPPNQ
ncbi:MAG: sensor histidine kinase [Chlorobi bacterium]|nr:sensor histidine kinase [Chlorobiota bacterium]